jgi:hypothetical protein
MKTQITILFIGIIAILFSCNNQPTSKVEEVKKNDTIETQIVDTASKTNEIAPTKIAEKPIQKTEKKEISSVIVYNFHLTNRCASCIAIEEATTKTLNTNFANELKSGKIKRFIIDVDDEKNAKLAEKYQVFGSSLLVILVKNGKENVVDLTGDGFKFARNKEERFIEILSKNIAELLK